MASALPTKNLPIYMTLGSATPLSLVPTAISMANPAVVTVASTTGMAKGDIVKMSGTDYRPLDGEIFVVGAVTPTTFELVGADTTGLTATLGAAPKATVWIAADVVRLCLNQFDIAAPSVSTIDTSTFCGEASLPGATTPGTLTLGGYVAKDDTGLAELVKAEADGTPRQIEIILPGDNGYFVGEVTFSGLGFTVPMAGAIGFTVTGTQSTKFKWVVAP